ncbi:MAG: DNA gyrase subunit A, partial [Myxococcota bacterium]|nr:DNA gyrase subunit A [Myxococcota bacterium]
MAERDDSQLSLLQSYGAGGPPPSDDGPPTPPADDPVGPPGGPTEVALHETTQQRYLHYALSVITSRALPDIRDGLKPVQRRILYAMFHNLHLHADGRFRKSAAVVGEVMAKYHPHGDQAIYDAMVRMAQSFSLRYPLVDGHGNFGSLDGDPPAAMRYTEAKLQRLAGELLGELKHETVDSRPTYDGTTEEPVVLPTRVPQLLVNGSTGIAVGMATNIPPHNLGEVINALIALIDDPELGLDDLLAFVPGPDFPTGGRIETSAADLRAIYETGHGPVTMAGEYGVEPGGGRKNAVITSIPYGIKKGDLISKIAEQIVNKKVPQILDVRDESTDDVRIVLELKRGANPEV